MSKFFFEVLATHNKARLGLINTAHGQVSTPTFMPVGTRGVIKTMLPEWLKNIGFDIILANTYHLMLKPGEEVIKDLGGLRKLMNWPKPILTDSGGFQIMSLSKLNKVSEDGATFKSHIDGKQYILTPEKSTEMQYILDSTITMVLDECISYPSSFELVKNSVELTNNWALRSKKAFIKRPGYGQFGIIQGSMYKELRKKSAGFITELDFDGYAIGGLAVGEGRDLMLSVLDYTPDLLPKNKPRYLMGVGKPLDIIESVMRGVDMFDCVIPTRSGRNGQAFTKQGLVNIKNSKYIKDNEPLEKDCNCPACSNYTKAYLHHLAKIKEILSATLLTWHNLCYFQGLMSRIRDYIKHGRNFDFLF